MWFLRLSTGAATRTVFAVTPGVLAAHRAADRPQAWQLVAFALDLIALLYSLGKELLNEAQENPDTA
jgi:hypothetical protein